MASAQIRFRCFRCNQLLAVKASRGGSTVACPKCGIELIVPEPESEVTTPPGSNADTGPEPAADPLQSLFSSIASSAPAAQASRPDEDEPDFLGLSPADIRVEPDVGLRPEPPGPPRVARARVKPAAPPAPSTPEPAPPIEIPVFEPTEESPVEAELAIRVPEEPVLPKRSPERARDDVVMPRAAVTAWSLFAILALALAFVAGLMVGHHLWITPGRAP